MTAAQRGDHLLALDARRVHDERTIGGKRMMHRRLIERITSDPRIFGGKPIVRGKRLAVEHVLGMLAAGDSVETILEGYSWLEREDVLACLLYAQRLVGHERVEPYVASA